ncbi:hypothetical protein ACFLS0_02260 [Candidatus Bipolaricaulota bacterium]
MGVEISSPLSVMQVTRAMGKGPGGCEYQYIMAQRITSRLFPLLLACAVGYLVGMLATKVF